MHLFQRHLSRPIQRFAPFQTSFLTESDRNDVAQERQAPRMQRRARFVVCQFRTQLRHNLSIVAIFCATCHDERMRIRLTQQVFHLVNLIRCIHRHQHRPEFHRRPKRNIPLRHIGRPHRHMRAGLNAQGNERLRKRVHVVAEFAIRAGVVQRCILKRILVREFLHHAVQHLRESCVNQPILLPHKFARASTIVVQTFLIAGGVAELFHILHELGENDLHIVQFLTPRRVPNKRNKPIIIHRTQSQHHIPNGQFPLAHQAVFHTISGGHCIVNMHVAYIRAEIFNDFLRAFPAPEIGRRQLPQGRQMVAGKAVQQSAQIRRVAKQTGGFQQQGDVLILRHG